MTSETTYQLLEKIEKREGIHDFLFIIHYPFNRQTDVESIQFIENKMRVEGYSNSLITKAKMISIEILQNILKHQSQFSGFLPYFAVGKSENEVLVLAGNAVDEDGKMFIDDALKKYLAIDNNDLKAHYKNALIENDFTEFGNLGIGLLEIVYRSNKKVDYYFDTLDEKFYSFNISVTL
jgi:hypothetical protein